MRILLITGVLMSVFFSKAQTAGVSLTANPNPFGSRTLLSYTLVANDTITILISDISGATKITLKSAVPMLAGSYQDSLNMGNFPDGIYFATIKSKIEYLTNCKLVKTPGAAIDEVGANNSLFKTYPNPVKDNLFLEFETNEFETGELTVYSSLGQIVYLKTILTQNEKVDMSEFSNGIYFLRYQSGLKLATYKVIRD